jgi:hypothetical protein
MIRTSRTFSTSGLRAFSFSQFVRCAVGSILAATLILARPAPAQDESARASTPGFAESVRPLLQRHCVDCHGASDQQAGLRLDVPAIARRGGDSGPLLVPGDPDGSELVKRLTSNDPAKRMPLDADPLPADDIAAIRRWIAAGAPWPEADVDANVQSDHWSFQPIRRPQRPAVADGSWTRTAVDHFVLARLEQQGIAPSREADRYTLARRLYLDLVGLLPPAEAVTSFVEDRSRDAYERLVDQLLASPHFGERWAMDWLDLARYGDSDGYEQDAARPYAYRWRDWLIGAINEDMPYDQFTIEQLAGDLLGDATEQQLLATGFHRHSPTNREGGIDKAEARAATLVDRVNTTGTVWLGLTLGCAECHSHKFDPLRQDEYYRMYAFFNEGVDEVERPVTPTHEEVADHQRRLADYESQVAALRERIEQEDAPQQANLQRQLKRLMDRGKPKLEPQISVFGPAGESRETHVHLRGDYRQTGARTPPGVPGVLPRLVSRYPDGQAADRLDLARWLVDPNHPLTARVEANRIWQHLFGVPLVATPDDFGKQGELPTHPELLDYLAQELLDGGWSRKSLIRQIVCSASYRQASSHRPELATLDPDNRWLHRQNRFRVTAELVRDLHLSASGLLNSRIGGPGFRPPVPDSFSEFAYRFQWNPDAPPNTYRRGLYVFVQRNMIFPMLQTFDRFDANVTCVQRERSNTALQALMLLNDPQLLEASRELALRVLGERGDAPLARLFLHSLNRWPTSEERSVLTQLRQRLIAEYEQSPDESVQLLAGAKVEQPAEAASWIALARVLLNTDEFITRE